MTPCRCERNIKIGGLCVVGIVSPDGNPLESLEIASRIQVIDKSLDRKADVDYEFGASEWGSLSDGYRHCRLYLPYGVTGPSTGDFVLRAS